VLSLVADAPLRGATSQLPAVLTLGTALDIAVEQPARGTTSFAASLALGTALEVTTEAPFRGQRNDLPATLETQTLVLTAAPPTRGARTLEAALATQPALALSTSQPWREAFLVPPTALSLQTAIDLQGDAPFRGALELVATMEVFEFLSLPPADVRWIAPGGAVEWSAPTGQGTSWEAGAGGTTW